MIPHINDMEWLTPQDIASAMHISVATVNREIARGHLVAARVGRINRITQEDFRAWVASMRTGVPA
ncbi:MAG: helix-turn-helix domain-containing protein [Clostridia bacterium]|nr:helix-turn-helix domain-containing protein [Clostridia bacterium]